MITPADAAVLLDDAGRLCAAGELGETATEDAVAMAVCTAVHDLLDKRVSVVSSSVIGHGRRPFAMVMLREHVAGGFLSGTASAEDAADALVEAMLSALGLHEGILDAVSTAWRARNDVRAVTIVQLEAADPDDDVGGTHARLARTMPAPGRLAVTTENTEYRVLRFPATALVAEVAPGAPVLGQIDGWMARAEALGP